MRRIEIAVGCGIPQKKLRWQQLEDAIKAYWLSSGRRPLGGTVAVGFEWTTPKIPPWTKLPVIWREIASRVGFTMKPNATPCMGLSRFQEGYDKLVLTLEGD